MNAAALEPLERRIVGALQIDGRATWRRIADVLGEPERTVSRRAVGLLNSGLVRVVGLSAVDPSYLARLSCPPRQAHQVATTLAGRADTVFVYTLADRCELLVELLVKDGDIAAVYDELGRIEGVSSVQLAPVLHYFRTVAEWRPGLLTADEIGQLEISGTPPEQTRAEGDLDDTDAAIVEALVNDGRTPVDAIAALGGFSEATARRRISALIRRGVVRIRAVVEPALLGRPVEAIAQIHCHPSDTMEVGAALAASPHVRYAATSLSRPGIVADIATRTTTDLRDLLTTGPLAGKVLTVEAALLLRAYKRGGLPSPAPG